MNTIECSWVQFKQAIGNQIIIDKRFIYRGHCDSSWALKTSLHRTGQWKTPDDIKFYMEHIVPLVHESVAAWEGRKRNLADQFELAQFLAYLQHYGFPTPLLDWTYSPFIAAYFAFEGINHFEPQCDHVAVYAFDKDLWLRIYKQSHDYNDKDVHVSVLEPSFVGNPKQFLQQGVFMYTNLEDIESHINQHQKNGTIFLQKYRMYCSERSSALRELRLMNITAMQLAPSIDSVCKKVAVDVSLLFPVGKSRSEITRELLSDLLTLRTSEPKGKQA